MRLGVPKEVPVQREDDQGYDPEIFSFQAKNFNSEYELKRIFGSNFVYLYYFF